MIRLTIALLFFAVFSEAKVAPKTMTEFNKKCPAPKICDDMYDNLESCKKGEKRKCDQFVEKFEQALPEYDCQRSFDATASEKYVVPAIWLCETHERFFNALSEMKTEKAMRLYGSKKLRATLDGNMAKNHHKKSENLEKKLKKN